MACAVKNPDVGIPHIQGGGPVTRVFDGKTIQSLRCPECGYTFFPSPTADELNKFYQEIYPDGAKSWYNVESDFAEWKRKPRAQRVIEIAERYGHDKAAYFHEIGCAFGGTVFELQQQGISASGTELNKLAVEDGKLRGALDIHSVTDVEFLSTRNRKPDVIYGYHVLEHIPDPVKYLQEIKEHLAPGGIIILLVPNAMAFFPNTFGFVRYVWYGYPEHVHLFSPRSTKCLAEASGTHLLEVATKSFGIERDIIKKSIALPPQSSIADRVRSQFLSSSMMDEELIFVISAKPSAVTRSKIAAAETKAEQNAGFEVEIAQLSANERLPDPWA